MNPKKSHRGRSMEKMQMFEIADACGLTLEELVGPKKAVLYPRNMQEVELLRLFKRYTPLQAATMRALIVGMVMGFLDDATVSAMGKSADPLGAALKWCRETTPAQRAAMEAEWEAGLDEVTHQLAEARAA